MQRFWPLILMAVGWLLIVGGFLWAGIPDQDPTPEMSARFAYHHAVADRILQVGGGLLLFGSLAGTIRVVVQRFQ